MGGPAAGKTVFLSVLYSHLWRGHNGTVLRAANGVIHSELLQATGQLLQGNVPAATAALRHMEFELEHDGHTYFLHCLDYPGELFRRVFYETIVDSPEAQTLHRACETADGILMLLDPQGAAENSGESDFALSNLIRFCQTRKIPPSFVLALTKRDETESLVGSDVSLFVRKHLPHGARLLRRGARLMHFCSFIRGASSITPASPSAVSAPLEVLLTEVQRRQWLAARGSAEHRASTQRAMGVGLWILIVFVNMLLAFFFGIVLRHFVEQAR